MAKKKKSRKHSTGMIVTKRLSGRGIGKVTDTKSLAGAVFPPLLGGGLAAAGAIGLEMLAEPKAGEVQTDTQKFIGDWASWLGVGVGVIGSLAVFAMVGAPQGVASAAGAFGVGGALGITKMLREKAEPTAGYRRVGAVVAQMSPMNRGVGAIVMSPVAGGARRLNGAYQAQGPSAGAVVQLSGVNTAAFGTPGFLQGRR